MTQHGLLIDYEFCTGCHACEMACKVEKGLGEGEWGIKLAQIGPWKLDGDAWEWDWRALPTQRCDLCAERVEAGKVPACVHHCQSLAMEFGPVDELSAKKATAAHGAVHGSVGGLRAPEGGAAGPAYGKGVSHEREGFARGQGVSAIQNNVGQALGLIYGLGIPPGRRSTR